MRSVHSRSAFSLIELIVALAITSVIALFVFGFATSLAKMWRTTESGVGTELDAQIAIDSIAKDLESAIFIESDGPMLAVSATSESDARDGTFSDRWVDASVGGTERPLDQHFDPSVHRYGWAGSWLRFFTSAPSFNAVGYQIIRRPAFSDSEIPRYLLHRTLIRQDNTMEGGRDIVAGSYRNGATEDGLGKPNLDGVILEDVIDFGVRFYVFDSEFDGDLFSPKGLKLIFPAVSSNSLDTGDTEHFASSFSGSDSDLYPDVVEVFIRVLDDVGADLLLETQEGVGELSFDEIVEQHGRLYRRMIRRPGRDAQG